MHGAENKEGGGRSSPEKREKKKKKEKGDFGGMEGFCIFSFRWNIKGEGAALLKCGEHGREDSRPHQPRTGDLVHGGETQANGRLTLVLRLLK